MATDLRERLTDLASHTPPGAPPADLWQRGVRRRRFAQAGSAAMVAVLVLLLGAGGLAWHTDRSRIEPVAPHGAPQLPDRFYEPSPWLGTFDDPPGPLVAVGVAPRSSLFHTREDLYGVTATGSRYGFLDVPDLADRADYASSVPPALSPDGRSVAFWMTGRPSGSPNTELYGQTITRIGVYDALTGSVRVASLPTAHGLAPEGLVWSDSRTVVMAVGQAKAGDDDENDSTSWGDMQLVAWKLEDASPHRLPVPPSVEPGEPLTAGQGFVITSGDSGRDQEWLLWPRHADRDRPFRVESGWSPIVADPGAARVVGITGNRNPARLSVGLIAEAPHRTTLSPVRAGRQYFRALTWTDDSHVLALVRNPVNGSGPLTSRLDLVDVDSGSTRTLVDRVTGGGNAWHDLALANDFLGAPSVHGEPPPDPWNRRGVALGLLIGSVLLGALVWGTRVHRA